MAERERAPAQECWQINEAGKEREKFRVQKGVRQSVNFLFAD